MDTRIGKVLITDIEREDQDYFTAIWFHMAPVERTHTHEEILNECSDIIGAKFGCGVDSVITDGWTPDGKAVKVGVMLSFNRTEEDET